MEINQLATVERHEAGAEFQLVDPLTGEKEDAVFKVQGTDSSAWRKALKEQRRAFIDAEEIDFSDHEYLWPLVAAIIVDWKGLEKSKKVFKYSQENARWLCQNSPMVVNQIFSFIVDRENFTNG
jgi:hypothetical protein